MTLKDFLKQFVDHNGMFRIVAGGESVLDWDVVDMVHEMEGGYSRFQPLQDSKVTKLVCICTGRWSEAISIEVEATPELVRYVRKDYVRKERDISNFCDGGNS